MFMAESEEISYVQSLNSIVQNSKKSIPRSLITSQVVVSNHILGGEKWRVKNNV